RWSHDGGRIAYVSNEGGNTSLWVIELPGGRREQVAIRERRYPEPVALLALEIVDERGRPAPARVSVAGPDGRGWAPDGGWRHAGRASRRTPQQLADQPRGEGPYVGEDLLVYNGRRMPASGYFQSGPDGESAPGFLLTRRQRFHASVCGRLGRLGLSGHSLPPD